MYVYGKEWCERELLYTISIHHQVNCVGPIPFIKANHYTPKTAFGYITKVDL